MKAERRTKKAAKRKAEEEARQRREAEEARRKDGKEERENINIPALPPMRLVERKRKGDDGLVEKYMVEVPWRLETQQWWEDVFASPMASEFHSSDRHGLFRLAVLIDEFWTHPSTQANAEIRLAQKDYGLTPLDRRRLEWTIASAERATDEGQKRRGATESAPRRDDDGGPDPRLHIVS